MPDISISAAGIHQLLTTLDEHSASGPADTWQLRFTASKCTVMCCTRTLTQFIQDYTLNNDIQKLSD